MTIPDPPWKQKTRPCPFYSQGRCLFSDSCNFLHDVKIRVKQPNITITDSTPDVIISSPQTSSVVASPTTRNVSVRSPPRSPRLSSLLLALGDAIQTDEEDDSVDSSPPLTLPSNAIVPYSRTPNDDLHSEELKNEDSGLPAPPDNDESEVENEVIQEVAQAPSADGSARSEPSDLLSPIEVKLAPAFLGQLDGPPHREDSIDSGYADNWTGPLPFALSPPKPTSSRRYSTLSLLSSPFGSPVRALSPKFGPSAVSAWPSSPIFSPVMSRAGSRPSSLRLSQASDDLDSPTDYHRGQLSAGSPSIASPEIDEDVTIRRSLPAASDEAVVEKTVVPANKSLDKTITSVPKRLPERAIPEPSMDVIEEAACTEPVVPHAEVNAESSNPSRSKDSLLEEDTSALYSSYYSEALYTNSPRNVELFSSSPVVSSTSPHPVTSPTPSVPRSSSREFDVPEFVTSSSKDVYYEKPSIAPTPVRSALSLSSPKIISPRVSSRQSSVEKEKEASAQVSQSASTKVPFGFRHSLARSRESTTSRPGSAPPTRHRPPALIGLSSGRSQSLNDNTQISPEEPLSSSKSSSRLRPLRLSMLLNSSTPSLLSSTSSNVFPAVTASSFTDYSQHSSPSVKSDHSLSQDHMLSNTHSERIPHRNSTIAISTTSQSLEYSYQPHSLPLSAPPINHPPASWNNATQSSHRISSRLTYISRPSSRLSERIPQPSIQEDEPSVFSHTNIRTFEGGEDSPSGLHEPSTNDTVLVHSLALHTSSSPSPQLQERSPLSRPITTAPASPPASHAISSLSPPSEQQSILPRHQSLAAATITSALPETQIAPQAIPSPSTHPEQRISIHRNPPQSLSRPVSVVSSLPHSPVHAIATPRPTLIFAIASDDPAEVRRVLESGEASPNDDVGPQSALAFALTSGQLKHRTEIVKLLLAYGANPASVKTMGSEGGGGTQTNYPPAEDEEGYVERDFEEEVKRKSVNPLDAADPATRYYISRAEAPQTRRASALIHRSFFRPLTKVRYEMVGQDRALEQLFRVLSMPSLAPIVVLLCGPSGHGKSLLARRFGSLLDVPTHTVNMTTLRSTHDIWRSYSMSPYEEPSSLTLADFLMENEGKRCVVVLDEIEKTENDTILSSLLMPWELGRCSFEAGHRHVNVSKVIWLGTSNIGHDLVFEHHSSRVSPAEPMTRDEYVDLMGILRPVVSDRLGPSLLSRVTTVLPFVPFTNDEKLAIAAEALFSLAEDAATQLPAATVEKLVKDSLHSYVPAEGARSLYRAVSAQLLETL